MNRDTLTDLVRAGLRDDEVRKDAAFERLHPRDPHTGEWIKSGISEAADFLTEEGDESGLIGTSREIENANAAILAAMRQSQPNTTGAISSMMTQEVRHSSYEFAQRQMEPVLDDLRNYADQYPDVLKEGRDWYPDAKKLAAQLARDAGPKGMTTSQSAAIFAILSQQAAWTANKERAENAIRVAGDGPVIPAERLKKEFGYTDAQIRAVSVRNGTDEEIMRAANIPAGALKVNKKKYPDGQDLVEKVRNVIRGEPTISDRTLHGPKVEEFYAAIMGDTEAVAMDAWMHRAAGLSTPIFKPGRSTNKMVREGALVPYEGEGGEAVEYKTKDGKTVTGKLATPRGTVVGGRVDPFDPEIKAKHVHWVDDPLTSDQQRPYAKGAITAVARRHNEDPRVTQAIIWLVLQRALGIERANEAGAAKGQKVEHKREVPFTRHNDLRPSFQIDIDPETGLFAPTKASIAARFAKAGFDPNEPRDPHTGRWIKVAFGAISSAIPTRELESSGRAAAQIESRDPSPPSVLNLAPITVSQLRQHPGRHGEPVDRHLGSLITPDRQGKKKHSLEELAASGVPWAADNGAFVALDKPEFTRMLDRIAALPEDQKPMWVAVPDSVGDSKLTRKRFEEWKPEFTRRKIKMAYVVQNGQRPDEIPWDDIAAVFIGGTWQDDKGRTYKGDIMRRPDGSLYGSADDAVISGKAKTSKRDKKLTPTERTAAGIADWKLSPEAMEIALEAKRRGKLVHWGRVNTPKRIQQIMEQGAADTFDGTNFGAGRRLPTGTHSRSEARRPLGPSRMRRSLDWITIEEHRRRQAERKRAEAHARREKQISDAFARTTPISSALGSSPSTAIDVGDDIERAARLLSEGKHVKLDRADRVSTLLDRLKDEVDRAQAEGREAKPIDLCKVSVPGTNLFCVKSKGIKRLDMPQLLGHPKPGSKGARIANADGEVDLSDEFLAKLIAEGHSTSEESVRSDHLSATQEQLNGAKVAKLKSILDSGSKFRHDPPLIVSSDGYIVDGHHRWAAKVAYDLEDNVPGDVRVDIIRVDMSITELLYEAKAFAKEWGIPQASVGGKVAKAIRHAFGLE